MRVIRFSFFFEMEFWCILYSKRYMCIYFYDYFIVMENQKIYKNSPYPPCLIKSNSNKVRIYGFLITITALPHVPFRHYLLLHMGIPGSYNLIINWNKRTGQHSIYLYDVIFIKQQINTYDFYSHKIGSLFWSYFIWFLARQWKNIKTRVDHFG